MIGQTLRCYCVMAAHAPGHSAWHWQVESTFSKIRNLLLGKALGRGWTEKDPLQEDLPPAEIIKRCTESAMGEYTQLLNNTKNEERLDWTVCARRPGDEPKDSPIPDAELIVEYYQQGKLGVRHPTYRYLRAESLDLGSHVAVKVPSCFELRVCMGEPKCAACQQLLKRKQQDKGPDFTFENLLEPLAPFGHHGPIPDLLPGRSAGVQKDDFEGDNADMEDREWKTRSLRLKSRAPRKRTDETTVDGPYKSFLQMVQETSVDNKQTSVDIPVDNHEQLFRCTYDKKCRFVANSKTEIERHVIFHHPWPNEQASSIGEATWALSVKGLASRLLAGCFSLERGGGAGDFCLLAVLPGDLCFGASTGLLGSLGRPWEAIRVFGSSCESLRRDREALEARVAPVPLTSPPGGPLCARNCRSLNSQNSKVIANAKWQRQNVGLGFSAIARLLLPMGPHENFQLASGTPAPMEAVGDRRTKGPALRLSTQS